MKKKALIIACVIVALLVILVLVAPLFIDANSYKPKLETELSSALGRQVEIGNISLALWSGSVSVDSVSIADDPSFSHSPFLTAKKLSAGVSIWPLIFSKRLDVTSFTISDPQVVLLRAASGRWNYSTLGTKGAGSSESESSANVEQAPASSSSSSSAVTEVSVRKFNLSNGTVTVGAVGSSRTHNYQNVDLEASDLSYTTQFPFKLTASTPGGGRVKLDGKAGPINATDTSLTPVNASIGVENLDLAATGFIEPSSGVGGIVNFNGNLVSDGKQATSKGRAEATKIRLLANASPATVPINLDYAANYALQSNTGTLTDGQIHIGKAVANLAGTFDAAGTTPTVQMKMEGKAMPVPDLEGLLPAIGVKLPSGTSLETGTLDTTLVITGPVDKLLITGPVNLANAKLAGFNLKGKLGGLASFAGLGGGGSSSDTEIQTLSAMLRVDPTGTHFEKLNMVVPSFGAMTGNGSVSATGELDCHLVAKLPAGSMAGSVGSAVAQLTGQGAGGGIPFKVTGTTASPRFEPDFGGGAKGTTSKSNPASTASGILGGLLKKKKPQ
jgi:AsmA protein